MTDGLKPGDKVRFHAFTAEAARIAAMCRSADRPLLLKMNNGNDVPLTELRWRIAAYAPGDTVNLADNQYAAPRYRGPGELQAGGSWEDCLPMPPLRAGYRPQTLEFRAERLQGSFSD